MSELGTSGSRGSIQGGASELGVLHSQRGLEWLCFLQWRGAVFERGRGMSQFTSYMGPDCCGGWQDESSDPGALQVSHGPAILLVVWVLAVREAGFDVPRSWAKQLGGWVLFVEMPRASG